MLVARLVLQDFSKTDGWWQCRTFEQVFWNPQLLQHQKLTASQWEDDGEGMAWPSENLGDKSHHVTVQCRLVVRAFSKDPLRKKAEGLARRVVMPAKHVNN